MRLLCIFPLLTMLLRAATGDITGASITGSLTNAGNGWALDVYISGLTTNGTFDFGFSGSQSNFDSTSLLATSTPKVVVSIMSPGFSESAVSNWTGRAAYADRGLRFPVSSDGVYDMTNDGSKVKVRKVLSDWVYPHDAVTATIGAGVYTSGGTPNNAGTVTVTNLATVGYPGVVGDWTTVPFQVITQSSFTLRAHVAHSFARDRKLVPCVTFIAHDEHLHTNSVTVSGVPVNDQSQGYARAVPEYIATMDASTFTDGDIVTCNFRAYPWIGESREILDTETPSMSGMIAKPLLLLNNAGGTLAKGVVFWSGEGTDATAKATNFANIAVARANPAKTFSMACRLLYLHNKANNNRTNGNGDFVLMPASTNGLGDWNLADVPFNGSDVAWLNVMPDAGVLQSQVVVTQKTSWETPMTHWYGVTFRQTADSLFFNKWTATDRLWLDHCNFEAFNFGSTIPINFVATNIYTTACTILNNSNQYSIGGGWLSLGNRGTDMGTLGGVYTALGNSWRCMTNADVWGDPSVGAFEGQTISYNEVFGANAVLNLGDNEKRWGVAVNGNCFEKVKESASVTVGISGGQFGYSTNVFGFGNTFMGNKMIAAYNDTTTGDGVNTLWHMGWRWQNNLIVSWPCKQDTFGSGTYRIGGWAVANGVGMSGNYTLRGTWPWEHAGLNGFIWDHNDTYAQDMWQFRTNGSQAGYGLSTGLGGGDYHLLSTAPTFGWKLVNPLPFDLDGVPCGRSDALGAYASGNVRKGGFF